MRVPLFVVNFVVSFVEIGLDEVRDKARDKGNLQGLSNKPESRFSVYLTPETNPAPPGYSQDAG